MATQDFSKELKILNASSNVDAMYGVYDTLEEAKTNVILELRKEGRTVGIKQLDGLVVEYWWVNSNDLTDDGLVPKLSSTLDKVSTVDVDKVYIKNADGTQAMKPLIEFETPIYNSFEEALLDITPEKRKAGKTFAIINEQELNNIVEYFWKNNDDLSDEGFSQKIYNDVPILYKRSPSGGSILGIGFNSNSSVTTGGTNFGIGDLTLNKNLTGSNNTALGPLALRNLTSGASNLAIGGFSMSNAITGSFNVAVGQLAMDALDGGLSNVAIGVSSGLRLTSGSTNTFIGTNAGNNITTGSNNTFIGSNSGRGFSSGTYNIGLGINVLGSGIGGSGSYNMAFGQGAGRLITTGSNNLVFEKSLFGNDKTLTTGSNNIIINPANLTKLQTGNNNTIIGRVDLSNSSSISDLVVLADGSNNEAIRKLSDNTLLAPSTNNTLIDADTTGKAIITKEWFTANGSVASPALGYTAEDVANKQNNLAVDGTGTKYPTVDAVKAELNNKISGSGTTNRLAKFTASGAVGDSLISENGTNLIIGNPLLGHFLFTNVGDISSKYNNSTRVQFTQSHRDSFGNGYGLNANGGFRIGNGFAFSYITASGTDLLLQAIEGRVGIGTTTPTEKLDVVGNGKFSGTLSCGQFTTATEPAYFKGAQFFNTTLNKIRIGGATAYETVTSN
jgi:hypothetical protein